MNPKTTALLEETARLDAQGDLYGYDPEINRAARNTIVVLLIMLALAMVAGVQSCFPAPDIVATPSAID